MTIRISQYSVTDDKPYSVFTRTEKALVVSIASFAALFSPLTANIYLPVIHLISKEFHKSVELINLTVTMYMVIQGITPIFWGTLSDRLGRRPVIFACLAILSCSCVGLALVPTSAYWLLMLLRCLQATGPPSIVAVGAGIIADIATPAERGGLIGIFVLGPLAGLSLGPVIGGALAQRFSWRAVFWFLCMSSTMCGFSLFCFLPETLRTIIGDGSVSSHWIYTPFIPIIGRRRKMTESTKRPPPKPFKNPLEVFTYPDVSILLLFNSTYYAVMYGVMSSLPSSFKKAYGNLTETDLGLCFIPIGGGMLIGSSVAGTFMDTYYRKFRDSLIHQLEDYRPLLRNDIDHENLRKDPSFPIEKARLHVLPYIMLVYIASIIGYGWSLQLRVTILVPLILLFIMGVTILAIMTAIQTLLVDLMPGQGSSIAACNNVIRCGMGAGMVSIMHPILVSLGERWTYTLLGGICVLIAPLLYVEVMWGPIWRQQRNL